MLHSLADTAALYAAGLGLVCLAMAVRRRARGAILTGAVVLVELALVGVALGETVRWAIGEDVSEPVVHLVYLLVSVAIVPIIAGRRVLTGTDGPARPGEAMVLAVALIAAAIVEHRLLATG